MNFPCHLSSPVAFYADILDGMYAMLESYYSPSILLDSLFSIGMFFTCSILYDAYKHAKNFAIIKSVFWRV